MFLTVNVIQVYAKSLTHYTRIQVVQTQVTEILLRATQKVHKKPETAGCNNCITEYFWF